jgi:3-hydroxyisobutyrate dehydrogenase
MAQQQLKVGFVGLGIMGLSMARNIRKAGFPLTVYNRTAARAQTLAAEGAAVASSPAEVAAASDVVVSCVTASADVLAVTLDATSGIVAGVRPGAVVVDCSTVAPAVAKQCAAGLAGRKAAFLDAPVSGGDIGARDGTLSIMVGGEAADLQRAMPVLQAMGKTITHCGPHGSGYVVKLCNQICGALHAIAASEAIALARSAGIDPMVMLQAVSGGAAQSWALKNLAPKMVAGDDKPGFFVDYQLKDLRLASEAAHSMSLPLPAAALAETLFRAASAQGHGRDGTQAVYHVIANMGRPPER